MDRSAPNLRQSSDLQGSSDLQQSPDPYKTPSSSDETETLRATRARFGLLVVTAIAIVMIVSAGPLVAFIDNLDLDENITIVAQLASFVPSFVAIGYAGVVPMLLFRRPLTRILGALIGQICGFAIYVLGCCLADEQTMSAREWLSLGGGLFLICALGGFVPTAILIWFRHWALVDANREPHRPRMGIVDLMALSAAGAGFLAFQREFGILSADHLDDMDVSIIVVTLFYMAIGIAVTSSLLVAMRVTLVERGDRVNVGTILGIVFTLTLVFGFWGFLIHVDGPMTDWHPLIQWFLNGMSSWMTAGVSAIAICIGLRYAGYRLTSIRTS